MVLLGRAYTVFSLCALLWESKTEHGLYLSILNKYPTQNKKTHFERERERELHIT